MKEINSDIKQANARARTQFSCFIYTLCAFLNKAHSLACRQPAPKHVKTFLYAESSRNSVYDFFQSS